MPVETLLGASSSDMTTLKGTELSDQFIIEDSNAYIHGLQGNDTVTSRSAVDNININAGEDNDTITFTSETLASSLNAGRGNDTINVVDFSGTIYGGAGDDRVNSYEFRTVDDSFLRGDGGVDYFNLVNIANTIINGNSGDDYITITGTSLTSQVYGGRQNDVITINDDANNSLIRGDFHEDTITVNGNLANSVINGNDGNDLLSIGSSIVTSSTIYGGKGNDSINISSDAINIQGGKGDDQINLTSSHNHTIYGGTGSDIINSNSTKSLFINGGDDSDTISLSTAAENGTVHTVDGSSGNDSITGSSGKEIIDGGTRESGEDTLNSGGGDDTIYGRAGNDLINLEAGSDDGNVLVQAGGGNDIIELNLGELTHEDIIKGEKGEDTLAVVGEAANFNMWEPNTVEERAFNSISGIKTLAFGTSSTIFRVSGTKTINLGNTVQAAGVEIIDASLASGVNDDVLAVNAFLFSSSTELTFIGSTDKDVNVSFTGGSGNDTLTTGTITEDAGDTLTGGFGVDTFNIIATDQTAVITDLGQGGGDAIVVANSAKGVVATVTHDYETPLTTMNNKASFTDVVLNAESGIDIDMGQASGSFGFVINGGEASSTLKGSKFDDSISGNSRADNLIGNNGDDTVLGGGGNDIINTGLGNGYIKDAGDGADTIIHDVGGSVIVQNTGIDNVVLTATRPNAFVVAGILPGGALGVRTVDASTSTSPVTLDGSGAGEHKVTYSGGSGSDTVKGGGISDVLTGNSGNDSITGGLGADTIDVGDGTNTVVFTSGLTIDDISGYTTDDIGAFDLSALKAADAVVNGDTLDFVTGNSNTVLAGDTIDIKAIIHGQITMLDSTTNVLKYSGAKFTNAAALETALEHNGGIVRADAALAQNDAFVIQYQDSDSDTYTYAIAHIDKNGGISQNTQIDDWEVTDIATTNLGTELSSFQFSYIA